MIDEQKKIEPFHIFKDALSDGQYEDIANEVSIHNFKKGQEIYSEKSRPLGIYSVEKGLVKLINQTDHRFVLFNIIKTNGLFNYQALVTESPNLHTAIALRDCVIGILPRNKFMKLYKEERTIRDLILDHLIEDVKMFHEKVLILAFNSIRIKLAMAFLYLNKIFKDSGQDGIILNRQELADFTGTTRETIIRTTKDFEKEKLLKITKGAIVIKDRDALQKLIDIELYE